MSPPRPMPPEPALRVARGADFTLTLLLASTCNLACGYCYHAFAAPARKRLMDEHTAALAFRHAFGGRERGVMVDFGEIACNEALTFRLLEAARRCAAEAGKAVRFGIQTNGVTLTSRLVTRLRQNDVFVGLSLDGPELLHDAMRHTAAGAGSYAQARAGLERIQAAGIPHIVSVTAHRGSSGRITEIVDHLESLGVEHFVVKPVLRRGSAAEAWARVGLSGEEYVALLRALVEHALKRRNLDLLDASLIQMIHRAVGDTRGWSNQCQSGYCGAGARSLVVNTEGYCYPCPRFSAMGRGDQCLGHITEVSVGSVMPLDASGSSALPAQCAACEWSAICGGGCPLAWTSGWGEELCAITSGAYELIFQRILPALANENLPRSAKLGDVRIPTATTDNRTF